MAVAVANGPRIRTNTPAENAYNAMDAANRDIALRQLRLSTGKRINNASDDVAGYITSRALESRNGALKSCLNTVGDAQNLANITMDSLDNINGLLQTIKDSTAQAASGALGTDEKVALAKAAYRLAQQIQTVCDSTVFGGAQLLDTTFTADFVIGYNSANTLLTLDIDMRADNPDFNIDSLKFNVNAVPSESPTQAGGVPNNYFAGVTNLNLEDLNAISATDLGMFATDKIGLTLTSLSNAINNVNKAATYLGGISNRLTSQEELLKNQITNYNAAISRLEDADVAVEQLKLIKSQFLQQTSIISLSQANQNPNAYMQLLQ